MRLSARFLVNVSSVNSFEWIDRVEFSEGDPITVVLQLIDSTLDRQDAGFKPLVAGRRYMPEAGATLQVVVQNIDDAKTYTKVATQLFPTSDPSLWSFTIAATDAVKGTPSLTLVLTEGAVIRRGLIMGALRVYSTEPQDC